MTKPLTSRSKVAIRYTTSPSDMGYGGTPTGWREGKPDVVTSPRKALEWLRDLKQQLGNQYYLVEISHGERVIDRQELAAVAF